MNIIKPKKLKKGDTIGIISLSGAVKDPQRIYDCQNFFEERGYRTVLSENIFDTKRYLAGDDDKKVRCLEEFFKNPDIDAILCSRGGYGAIRIVNKIDYDLIRHNPKIFAGYSDVTALSVMMLKRSNLVTFSAPMASGDFGIEDVSEFTQNEFFKTLSYKGDMDFKTENSQVYCEGLAQGILFGGNLSTVVSLCGLDFIPDEKFIFFAEDLNEDVYRIDKMFNQLINIEKFEKNLAGIVLGEFLDITNPQFLKEFFEELAKRINRPIMGEFKITHAKEKLTIPIGAYATMDTDKKTINIKNYLSDI